jgi:uncharacterized membrane protein (DUF373 family)
VPAEPLVGDRTRRAVTRVFRLFEDVIFVGLGLLLAGCALYLLVAASGRFLHHIYELSLTVGNVVELIEKLLLILLVVEILYTVQVSFREHTLAPEPFLLIGLIAAVRRVLVITAELAEQRTISEVVFRHLMIELGVLTVLILALVSSVMMLRRNSPGPEGSRRD